MKSKKGLTILLVFMALVNFVTLYATNVNEIILAKFKGGKITKKQFKQRLNELPGFYRSKITSDKDKEKFLDQLVIRKIFYLEAVKNGYKDSLSVLKDIADKSKGYLYGEYKKRHIRPKVKVSNKEKRDYYVKHTKDKAIFGKTFKEVSDYIEKKLIPLKDKELENNERKRLEKKYDVTYNLEAINKLNIKDIDKNKSIEDLVLVKSPNDDLQKTVKDFILLYKKMPAYKKSAIQKDGVKKFIESLNTKELFYLEALKEGLDKDPNIKKTLDRYKENTILQHYYKNVVLNKIPQTDKDIKKYYDEHLSDFSSRAERKIRAFYFKDEKTAKKIRKKIAKLLKKKKEKDIIALLKKYSVLPEKDGVIEHIYKNEIVPGFGKDKVFFNNIWSAKKGEVSNIFKNSKGNYTFFYILEDKSAKPMEFSKIKDRVKSMMLQKLAKEKFENLKKEYYKDYDVQIFNDKIPDILPAQEYFKRAMNAENHKRYKDAIFYYDKIIKYYPNKKDDYKAYFMKAYIYSENLDDKQKALSLFKKVINDFPKGDLHESAEYMIKELTGKTKVEEKVEKDK